MSKHAPENHRILDALRRAVSHALERKRRLGQYAIVWKDGHPATIKPAPVSPSPTILQEDNAPYSSGKT